jgi:hypothetical protein
MRARKLGDRRSGVQKVAVKSARKFGDRRDARIPLTGRREALGVGKTLATDAVGVEREQEDTGRVTSRELATEFKSS